MSASLLSALKAKQQELKNKTGREKTVKPPAGSSRWRILPNWKDDPNALFSHDYGQHFIKDFSGTVKAVYVCTLRTFNKPCPICEAMARAATSASDENAKKLIEEARAQQVYLVNAVRKTDKGVYEKEVSILALPMTAFNALVTVATQYAESDELDIFDPVKGYDVIIDRSGTGPKNTKYTVMVAPKSSAIDAEYLAKRVDLEQYCDQEYEQGKTAALVALAAVSGSHTPALSALPAATLSTRAATVAAPAATVAAVAASTPTDAELDDALSVDLSDVDLDGLEAIE